MKLNQNKNGWTTLSVAPYLNEIVITGGIWNVPKNWIYTYYKINLSQHLRYCENKAKI